MKRRRGVQRPGGCFACFICPEAGVWRSAFCCIIPCLWIGPYHYYTILSIDRRPQNTSLHIEWQKENYRYILFSQSRSSSHHTDCTACWTTGVSTFPFASLSFASHLLFCDTAPALSLLSCFTVGVASRVKYFPQLTPWLQVIVHTQGPPTCVVRSSEWRGQNIRKNILI